MQYTIDQITKAITVSKALIRGVMSEDEFDLKLAEIGFTPEDSAKLVQALAGARL